MQIISNSAFRESKC